MFREKFPVPDAWASRAWADDAKYQEMYQRSIDDPDGFWSEQGQRLEWIKPFTRVSDASYDADDLHVKWYYDGVLNASANCIDRHLATRGEQTAIIWEGDDPKDDAKLTYKDLHEQVCRFANGLKSLGVKKGDRITIYLPMIPEIAIAMLACARIGAVHSVVFGGFSPDSIAGRIEDCDSTLVITSDEGLRGGRTIPLKDNVDQAIEKLPDGQVSSVVVVNRTGADINWVECRDVWYHELCEAQSADCAPEPMDAEDPLFILYTSGSTGKPKGVLHTTGGYMVYASMTHQYVFDYHDGDIYWCTADCGWITGHSYIVYGPLSNGATTLIFEGLPNYPDASRHWEVCDKHQVNIYYTAPTAIRALMREGDDPVKKTSRGSIRLLGTVGEPINPEAWHWYHSVVGDERCPIVDTWWQTETGGILITPLPGATLLKPGSATRPFFGVRPVIVDAEGNEVLPWLHVFFVPKIGLIEGLELEWANNARIGLRPGLAWVADAPVRTGGEIIDIRTNGGTIDDDGRLSVKHGDSFIMWIEWLNGKPVASRSIQPYGAAITRPGSPHFADQSTLFVQHRLKPVHFWREEVLANAVRRYTVSSDRTR